MYITEVNVGFKRDEVRPPGRLISYASLFIFLQFSVSHNFPQLEPLKMAKSKRVTKAVDGQLTCSNAVSKLEKAVVTGQTRMRKYTE